MIIEVRTNDSGMRFQTEETIDAARVCPLCHTSFNGATLAAKVYPETRDRGVRSLFAIHFCSACDKMFFATYFETDQIGEEVIFTHLRSFPERSKPEDFPDKIKSLSPNFVKIYNQALSSEKSGLDEICGFGYRRALEFLIKDFAKYTHAEESAEIETTPLVKCITRYIDHPKLKIVAERAVWLGNDHAHYVAKHIGRDLEDLKLLVNLSVHWISMELETAEAGLIQKQ